MNHPLLLTAELRALEQRIADTLPPGTLMQRAGSAAAQRIHSLYGNQNKTLSVLVICGPGNNGGDGYVCACELLALGHRVQCLALAAPASAETRVAAAQWHGPTLLALAEQTSFDVVVDAMFGIGLSRALSGEFLSAAQWMQHQACVVALDVPSGLDADRGTWVDHVTGVTAQATVTFLADKPGLHTADGCDAVGQLFLEPLVSAGAANELASTAGLYQYQLSTPADFAAALRPRLRNSHKGRYGNVLVVGGNLGMTGAALLAARAALRLGAGKVFVDAIGAPELKLDPLYPELMFRRAPDVNDPYVAVVGCGLGTDVHAVAALEAQLLRSQPLVLDADALNLLALLPALQRAFKRSTSVRVLTPHPLEAARLLNTDAGAIQHDRLRSALQLAQQFDAAVVLKGAGSVIALPRGPVWINPTGGPALATAGSGDVLAGMIAALLAQDLSVQEATLAAVWLHGRAADEFAADVGLVASDIAVRAADELARLKKKTLRERSPKSIQKTTTSKTTTE